MGFGSLAKLLTQRRNGATEIRRAVAPLREKSN